MYIRKITIKNFRNFGDPPFEMALKPFTLVLGENNIGKTNLLSAIALLFSQEISVSQRRALEIEDINYEAVSTFKRKRSIIPPQELATGLGDHPDVRFVEEASGNRPRSQHGAAFRRYA